MPTIHLGLSWRKEAVLKSSLGRSWPKQVLLSVPLLLVSRISVCLWPFSRLKRSPLSFVFEATNYKPDKVLRWQVPDRGHRRGLRVGPYTSDWYSVFVPFNKFSRAAKRPCGCDAVKETTPWQSGECSWFIYTKKQTRLGGGGRTFDVLHRYALLKLYLFPGWQFSSFVLIIKTTPKSMSYILQIYRPTFWYRSR